MVTDLIETTMNGSYEVVLLSVSIAEQVSALRDWLHENVYMAGAVEDEFRKASRVLRELFVYFMERPGELNDYGGRGEEGETDEIAVADFLAGMTDRYAMNLYQKLFFPQPWKAV